MYECSVQPDWPPCIYQVLLNYHVQVKQQNKSPFTYLSHLAAVGLRGSEDEVSEDVEGDDGGELEGG